MPFKSINCTHPRTNPRNFQEKILRIGEARKMTCLVFVFSFLVIGLFKIQKTPRRFIWGSVYFCTVDGFFRILKKAVSELICIRLYPKIYLALCPTRPIIWDVFEKSSHHMSIVHASGKNEHFEVQINNAICNGWVWNHFGMMILFHCDGNRCISQTANIATWK